jgi:hypothetical protein
MAQNKKYVTDTEAGIRNINTIRKLPSCQLTDEEFVKEFFDRFEAKAMVLLYVDKTEQQQTFGRLKKGSKVYGYYRGLLEICSGARPPANIDFKEV